MTAETFGADGSANAQIEFKPIFAKPDAKGESKAESSSSSGSMNLVDILGGGIINSINDTIGNTKPGTGPIEEGHKPQRPPRESGSMMNDIPSAITPADAADLPRRNGSDFERHPGEKIKVKEAKDIPLTRTENLILRQLDGAVMNGDAKDIQEAMQALNEQSESSRNRVLNELRNNLQKRSSTLLDMNWETGTNNNGQSFTRLRLSSNNDNSKSSGSTTVTIGSDGPGAATYTDRWDSPVRHISADKALAGIAVRLNDWHKPLKEEFVLPNKKFD